MCPTVIDATCSRAKGPSSAPDRGSGAVAKYRPLPGLAGASAARGALPVSEVETPKTDEAAEQDPLAAARKATPPPRPAAPGARGGLRGARQHDLAVRPHPVVDAVAPASLAKADMEPNASALPGQRVPDRRPPAECLRLLGPHRRVMALIGGRVIVPIRTNRR